MLGTRQLIERYFQSTTDLALHYRMAQELTLLGLALPPELTAAVEAWGAPRSTPFSADRTAAVASAVEDERDPEDEGDEHRLSMKPISHETAEEAYNGDLAPIYTLPLDERGSLQPGSLFTSAALPPDQRAVVSAITTAETCARSSSPAEHE